jgi:DNA-binding MarR family transcriptional regulator
MNLKSEPLLEESVILMLFDVVNYMTKNSEIMALKGGLTVQQWLVLLQIAGDPSFPETPLPPQGRETGVLASDIATARGVSRANISTVVTALLRKQYIRQVEDPVDRRRKFLNITDKGTEALKQIEPVRNDVNEALFDEFTSEEMTAALQFLRRCLEKLWHLGQKKED